MFRVLLKIVKVNLRVIEPVELHILIRKDHRYFTYCRGEPLANGEATLTNSTEFLIDAANPRFEIQLFLVVGQTRKRGGVVPINLKAFTINSSHHRVEQIKKTPLKHCSLEMQLVYMRSEYRLEESLISVQRLEEMIHSSRIRAVIDEHQKLIFRNNSLANEVEHLRQANEVLLSQQRQLAEKEQKYEEEILLIAQSREGTQGNSKFIEELALNIQQSQKRQENKQSQQKAQKQKDEYIEKQENTKKAEVSQHKA